MPTWLSSMHATLALPSPSFKTICDRRSAFCCAGKPGLCETPKKHSNASARAWGLASPRGRVTAPQVHALTNTSRSECGVPAN